MSAGFLDVLRSWKGSKISCRENYVHIHSFFLFKIGSRSSEIESIKVSGYLYFFKILFYSKSDQKVSGFGPERYSTLEQPFSKAIWSWAKPWKLVRECFTNFCFLGFRIRNSTSALSKSSHQPAQGSSIFGWYLVPQSVWEHWRSTRSCYRSKMMIVIIFDR